MSEQLDYTTLAWVKDEIQESLNQTHQALEAYIEDPSDTTQIRFCATYLHQVYGTLQMVEIYGAALLAEEMEKVANAMLNNQISQPQDAFEVLFRATLQLPAYLERLEQGQPDLPVVLTPLLNDMRAARGEPLLSENAFFSPDLNVAPPEKRLSPGKEYPEIQAYAKKLRPIYQISLLGLLRNKDAAGSLKKMAAVLRELQNASDSVTAQRLWWIAGGIVESLIDEGLVSSTALKMLLGQVDRELKRLINDGENTIEANPPADLIKNCLYYTGTSSSNGPRVTALKQAFNLAQLLPYGGALEDAMDALKGSTAGIMESVSAVIKEDLLHVKDQLDIFVRTTERSTSELTPLAENLSRIADTLAMLSLGDLRKVIQDQANHLKQLIDIGDEPADRDLMEVASALLYVESSLDNLKESRSTHSETNAPDLAVHEDADSTEVLLPRSEQIQITNLVIKEAKEVLADVKEGFNTFAVEPSQFDAITDAPAKLAQIQGALAVMNYTRAANLLGAANAFIREDVISAHAKPDTAKLDTLADAITSIEYFLEAIEEGRGNAEGVLAVAEISVEQLGHPVESVSPIINVGVEAAPSAELTAELTESPDITSQIELASTEATIDDPDKTQDLVIDEPTEALFEQLAEPIEMPAPAPEPETVAVGAEEAEEYLEEDIDEEILEIFVEEADEVLGTMTDCLHAWRANNDDHKSLETLRRSYHTIKGSGRLAGAMVMGEFAWSIEAMLNRVLDNKISANPAMFALLDNAEIVVRALLAHLKNETNVRPPIKPLMNQADAMAAGTEFSVSDIASITMPQAESATENTEDTIEYSTGSLLESDILDLSNVEDNSTEELSSFEEPSEFEEATPTEDSLHLADSINELEDIALELTPDTDLDESLEFSTLSKDQVAAEEVVSSYEPTLVEVFRKETATHIGAIREFLFNAGGADTIVDDNLHRALHTLHGSARMADVAAISEISEPMDRLIRAMHEHAMPLDYDGQSLLRKVADNVETIAASFTDPTFVAPDHSEFLSRIAELRNALSTTPSTDTSTESKPLNNAEDAELISIFIEEADEILANTDALMLQWSNSAENDNAAVSELQRALHTLKGGARLANFSAIGDLTHDLESLLEDITERGKTASDQLPLLVQQCLDWLANAIEEVRSGKTPLNSRELRDKIATLCSSHVASIDLPSEEPEISFDLETDSLSSLIVDDAADESLDELFVSVSSTDEADNFDFSASEISTDAAQDAPLEETHTETEEFEELEEFEDHSNTLETAATEPQIVTATPDVDYDPDLLEVFLEEADELQESTENTLHNWSSEFDNLEHVAELQRLLHTLKGGARMANVVAVGDLAHEMESLLERITDGRTKPSPEHIDIIQSCHDWLITGLNAARKLQPAIAPTELLEQLKAAIRGETFGTSSDTAKIATAPEITEEDTSKLNLASDVASDIQAEPVTEELDELSDTLSFDPTKKIDVAKDATASTAEEQIRVRADLLDNLVNFSGEINIYNSRIAQQLGASRFNLAELDQTVHRLREQLRKFEIETETQIMYRHETTSTDNEDFDPLEMDRFSTMQQLSRGMVESLGDLTSIQVLLDNLSSETDVLLLQQQRVTAELQDGLLHTRMVSFSSVLPRLRRIMRQTCKEIGKEAELMVSGGEGDIDRSQLNRIIPALEHILRNAIGHGLETPEVRVNSGKPPSGNVHIAFSHQGSEVMLTISDDGAGINIDALRAKAIEKGRMLADADLSDAEIIGFILESGFSTAAEITQISGRGVGMDVVNTEVKQLGGTLHIDSEVGKGTTFTLLLPLTVLVNQALLVQAGEATYAIQLPNIEHVVRAGRSELEPLISGEQVHFEYAGNQYQYLNLGMVLHGTPPQLPAEKQRVPLMLIRSADHRIALHVDILLGRQEIVIKSVGPQLSTVGVLSGATILPDGHVALILDIANLVRSALAQQHGRAAPLLPTIEETAAAKDEIPTVMIVDDSITVRKVTERLLKRYDYNIITAKDGVDALTVMIDQIPDIMLLDVEMPRMDGYELATTMRNDTRLKDVPIIMITSRTGDKHRQRAFNIGVNKYMGKPYQEQELIENIRALTGVTQD